MPTKSIDDVIAEALTPAPGLEPVAYQREMAARVVKALQQAKYTLLAPEDLEWGECPGEGSSGPHHVSLSLCSGCLEYDPE